MPQISREIDSDSDAEQSDSENSSSSESEESRAANSENEKSDNSTKGSKADIDSDSESNSDGESGSGGSDSSGDQDSDNRQRGGESTKSSEDEDADDNEDDNNNEDDPESPVNSSPSSSHSKSSSRRSKSPRGDSKKFWEENPDIYGIRRSGRERKQPERIALEQNRTPDKKSSRRSFNHWNSSDGLSEDSDSESERHFRRKQTRKAPARKKTFRYSDSEDSDRKIKRISRAKKEISYIEASEEEVANEDIIEVDWSQQPKEDENAQTIDKVITHRIGKKGAVGMQTYIYEVDNKGDPNSDFDPKDPSQTEMQFLIKWKGWAYVHNTWESEESLKTQKVKGMKKVENYLQREREVQMWKNRASPEEVEYTEIQLEMERDLFASHIEAERIFAEAVENNNTYYYIKWKNLPYIEATWELEDLVIDRYSEQLEKFRARENSSCFPKQCPALKHRPKFSQLKTQPYYLGDGNENLVLRDYQLDGLNWLIHSWCKHNSVILADEMGLGKTIQTIAFLSYLFHEHHLYGPFILVLPLSTLNAWQKEFELWAPDMNVIVYIGDRDSRKIIQQYEWIFPSRRIKFNAVLTTYEILLRDKEVLQESCQWAALMVDEAHRLKNGESQLYQAIKQFKTDHRILITGTPLQNSLKELWALLHFIMPQKFDDWEYFESQHDGDKKRGFHRLHKQLEPYLLRRVKKDVEKSLPAKVEQILRVDMTQLQKQYYKWILTKNYDMLRKGNRGSTTSFINIVMELKKCCNHSSLIKQTEDFTNTPQEILQQLLRGSGKLLLLDKLLVRLNETGHRVLIFSQMVRMLDILALYLQYRRFPFQRLDGSISGDLRRQALDHFNAESSTDFCFLLSTRAGGLGINLATADTVIIFDSDWNPQNDLQAQARAHRIGQKNQVNIYRLVTKNSIEETIIERAKQKMVLDHLVIQSMDTSGRTVFKKNISSSTPFNKEELNSILKFGAEELFKDDEENEEEPMCDIDEILQRAETRDEGPLSAGEELLSGFKVASFNLNEDEETSKLDSVNEDTNKEWDDIIPEGFRDQIEKEEKEKELADLYLPPRKRKTLSRQEKEEGHSPNKRMKKDSESSAEDDSDSERPKKRGRPRMHHKETVKGFTDAEVRRFFKSFKKFANPLRRLDTIAMDADMREKTIEELENLGTTILEKCQETIKDYEAQKVVEKPQDASNGPAKRRDRGPSFKLSNVSINAKTTLGTLEELDPLDRIVPHAPVERASWVLPFRKIKDVHWDTPWSVQDDSRLLRGIFEYGIGSWEQLKGDPALNLGDKILLEGDLKPQAKHLENRTQFLLKLINKNNIVKQPAKPKNKIIKPKKVKATKAISIETIENDDSTDEESGAAQNAVTAAKKLQKELVKEEKESHIENKELKSKVKEEEKFKDEEQKENDKKVKKKKKSDRSLGPLHITAKGEPIPVDMSQDLDESHPQWLECKEKMRPMKKPLKMLDNPNETLSPEEQIQNTRRCLIQIGDHIDKTLQQYHNAEISKEWKNLLWKFVSKFTEYDAKKLHKLYKKHKKLSEEKKDSLPNKDEKKEHKKDKERSHKKHHHHHHRGGKKEREFGESQQPHNNPASQKRHHEEDNNSMQAATNKRPFNGWSNERSRDGDKWNDHDNPRDHDKSRSQVRSRDGRERGYHRGHGSGAHRDWHNNPNNRDYNAKESRYPEDFKREPGGYRRDMGFKSHGYHRGPNDWGPRGHRPKHPYGPHMNYGVPHYPPHSGSPGMYGSMPGIPPPRMMHSSHPNFASSQPHWNSKGGSEWQKERLDRPPKPEWNKKDPRQDSSRQDRSPYPQL